MDLYLRRHPDIYMVQKELHYFGSDLEYSPRIPWDIYTAHFRATGDKKCVGESAVWYLYSTKAALEIKEFSPNAKIIAMLRNPIDMIHSLHSELVYGLAEDILDFEEALAAESDRKQGRRIPEGTRWRNRGFHVQGLLYRETAKFSSQLTRYFDTFGRDNVHVIILEDLRDNPADVYQHTLRFLGVDHTFRTTFDVINANKTVRWAGLKRLVYQPPKIVQLAGKIIPKPLGKVIMRTMKQWNKKETKRPKMPDKLRQQLATEFRPEVVKLSALLNRDLTHWCD